MITHLPRLRTVPVPDREQDRLADYYAKRGYVDGVAHCHPFAWIRSERSGQPLHNTTQDTPE